MDKKTVNAYIASSVKDGGIYRYILNTGDGSLTYCDRINVPAPSYMQIYKNKMYIVLSNPFEGIKESGMIKCDINADGSFGRLDLTETISTQGTSGCHIAVFEENVYVANYSTGSLIKINNGNSKLVTHSGKGPNADRQERAHVHHVVFTPDNKYLCATDLGIDAIIMYDHDLNYVGQAAVPAGCGPRHIVFSPCGKYVYCVNELGNSVTSLTYDGETLQACETISILPNGYKDGGTAAAIRVSNDGKFVYASNRGHNSIACCKADGVKLEIIDIVSCGGKWPRDFNLTPDNKFIFCTNEHENTVTSFKRDEATGKIRQFEQTLDIPAPLCVIFEQFSI